MIARRSDKKVNELEEEIKALEQAETGQADPEEKPSDPPQVEQANTPEPSPATEKSLAKSEELDPEEATFKKRYGDLRRHAQKVENDLKQEIDALKNRLNEQPTTLPTNPDEIKAWADKYPQVAAVIRAIADEQAKANDQEIKTKITELETRSEQLARKEEEARIRKAHNDFDDIVKSNDFHTWAENQPTFIQDRIYDGTADETIWAVTLYKKEKGVRVQNDTKEAAKSGLTKSEKTAIDTDAEKGRFSESMVDKMSPQEYADNEEVILKAIREGKFVYDLTGALR